MSEAPDDAPWPLLDRFPRLAVLPRVALRHAPTPVEHLGSVSQQLWVKRDDLSADPIGGNKVRALEFLLGQYPAGSDIISGGARGSTHVLATAVHARAAGLRLTAASWPMEMNDVAVAVSARIDQEIRRREFDSPVSAALWLTWRHWRGDKVVPLGGTSPLAILGHVNAALELADQVRTGLLPAPRRVVVPFGTGGTAAGLALGFAIAGLRTTVLAARVVPRVVAHRWRIRRLARAAEALIERATGARVQKSPLAVEIEQGVYGGAYGRPLPGAAGAAVGLPSTIGLDPTYSGKALVAAVESAREADTLFWLTFDSRWMVPTREVR